jgi:hypothetical protein
MDSVEKRKVLHDLAAYEEALTNPSEGVVSQLPLDTHQLHGVSLSDIKSHLRGASHSANRVTMVLKT